MRITVISACKSSRKDIKTEKGQSFLIQTPNRSVLYDFGGNETLLKNLQTLEISADAIDAGYLSCGTTAHSGGVVPFVSRNLHATVYARENAFLPRYRNGLFGKKNVTVDPRLHQWNRMVHCKKYTVDDSGKFVTFSLTEPEEKPNPVAAVNAKYSVRDEDGNFLPDDFSHEMYLLVKEGECWTLFCGDAHAGIVNIVDRAEYLVNEKLGGRLTAVIGAWSLAINGRPVSEHLIGKVAKGLKEKNLIFYTGHTTGEYAFTRIKETLGDKLRYYSAGDEIVL